MEKNMDRSSFDPLPPGDMPASDQGLMTEVKREPGLEYQESDGTEAKAVSPEAEEVQVKVEPEDETSAEQCWCSSTSGSCAACTSKGGRTDGNNGSDRVGLDGERYHKESDGMMYLIPYILMRRDPETGSTGYGFLGLARGDQNLEGAGGSRQETAVGNPPNGWIYKWCPVNVQGGVSGSASGREERRAEGMEGVVQPQVPVKVCKVEPMSDEETGVDRMVGGGEQEVHVQPRMLSSVTTGVSWSGHASQWSDNSSAIVASSSSSCHTNLSEPSPNVFNLVASHLGHCKQEGLQSTNSDVHQGIHESSNPHLNVMAVPEGLRKYVCPHCQYRAHEMRSLQLHIEAIHEGVRDYPCSFCVFRAKYKSNLKEHIKTVHEGLEQTQVETIHYPCPHCSYSAAYKGHLLRHIETVHEGTKRYSCPQCPYRSGYKHLLRVHIETVHEGLYKYLCSRCGYKTGKKGDLQNHINAVHEGLKRHQCPHCPYKSDHSSTLQRHVKTVHEGVRKYHCPRCQYKAGQKSTLQEHIEAVHEGRRKYSCRYCHFKTAHKSDLQIHIDTVHERLRKHHCPHCQYCAGRKGSLRKHIQCVHESSRSQDGLVSTEMVGEEHAEDISDPPPQNEDTSTSA